MTSLSSNSREQLLTHQGPVTSPLLNLPGEIRNIIYHYVFSQGRIFLQCGSWYNISKSNTWTIDRPRVYDIRLQPSSTRPQLALLRVCQKIYKEATLLPIKFNEIHISDLWTLNAVQMDSFDKQRGSIRASHQSPLGNVELPNFMSQALHLSVNWLQDERKWGFRGWDTERIRFIDVFPSIERLIVRMEDEVFDRYVRMFEENEKTPGLIQCVSESGTISGEVQRVDSDGTISRVITLDRRYH